MVSPQRQIWLEDLHCQWRTHLVRKVLVWLETSQQFKKICRGSTRIHTDRICVHPIRLWLIRLIDLFVLHWANRPKVVSRWQSHESARSVHYSPSENCSALSCCICCCRCRDLVTLVASFDSLCCDWSSVYGAKPQLGERDAFLSLNVGRIRTGSISCPVGNGSSCWSSAELFRIRIRDVVFRRALCRLGL